MNSTPLFDHVFKAGESSIPSVAVKARAIKSQPVALARNSDPETSHAAAEANPVIRGKQKLLVYEYLLVVGAHGATDYEIGRALNLLRTSAGKRRKELCDLGYVIDSGTRRQTDSKVTAIVWKVK